LLKLRITRSMRTALSGLAATAVDLATLITLVEGFGMGVGAAAFLAATCGAIAQFALAKCWAFRDRSPVRARQVSAYALVALGNALFVASAVHLVSGLGAPYLIAKAVAAFVVFVSWSYPAQKRLVFVSVNAGDSLC
jgi:putative flippase GtrA